MALFDHFVYILFISRNISQALANNFNVVTKLLTSKQFLFGRLFTVQRSIDCYCLTFITRWSCQKLFLIILVFPCCNRPFSKMAAEISNMSKSKTYTSTR